MVRLLAINPANLYLALIPLLIAIIDWVGVAKVYKRLRLVTKPGVILALLGLLWIFTGFQWRMIWFALALVFSLFGDIFLVISQERFRLALISFLVAHISYIIAYGETPAAPILPGLLVVAGLVGIGYMIHLRIAEGLTLAGKDSLKIPVLIYQLTLTLMVFFALNTLWHPFWTPVAAIWTSAGALLFLFSDSILAWNRFVRPIANGRLILTITYHLGQIAMIIGAILHFPAYSYLLS
jgi:uncharacterized membrane protein YhhN